MPIELTPEEVAYLEADVESVEQLYETFRISEIIERRRIRNQKIRTKRKWKIRIILAICWIYYFAGCILTWDHLIIALMLIIPSVAIILIQAIRD